MDSDRQRQQMVQTQIAARGVTDARVLAAMGRVPRERFVPATLQANAYDDAPLPIGDGQTISQPFIVAYMVAALGLEGGERVLEIGTGSGYAAAVLAEIAAEVYTVERLPALAESAAATLSQAGYDRIKVRCGDGTLGWPEAAPFDAILVSAGGPDVPATLRDQLAPGGRLIMPVGQSRGMQRLLRVTRTDDGFDTETLDAVRFVPLIGAEGWSN